MISEMHSNTVTTEHKTTSDSYALRLGEGLEFGEFCPALRRLTVYHVLGASRQVSLGYAEAYLLEYFITRPDEMISRQELLDHAWGDRIVSQGSLNQAISTLRALLGDDQKREVIITVPRRGYQFNADTMIDWQDWLICKQQILSVNEVAVTPTPAPLPDTPKVPAITSEIYRFIMPAQWTLVGLLSLSLLLGLYAQFFYTVFPPYSSEQVITARTRITLVAKDQAELAATRKLLSPVLQQLDVLGGGQMVINRVRNYLQFNRWCDDGTLQRLLVHIKHLQTIEDGYLQGCLR